MENIRFGMVCATIMRAITAVFWDKKKGPAPQFMPHDFLPSLYQEEKKEQTVDDMAKKLREIAQKIGE